MSITHHTKMLTQRLLVIIIFLLLWEISSRSGAVDPIFIPPPSIIFQAFGELIISGELIGHTMISLERAFTGFAIASILAVPLGFLIGWFKTFEKYLDPLLQTFRQLPTLALFPVFILLFGIGEVSKIAIIAKACFWTIFLNTVTGVGNVDPLLVKSAKSMGISKFNMFKKVVLPAAVPSIFSGLRLSGTIALVILVAAEMLGAKSGLGYAVNNWQLLFLIPQMYAAIVMLTLVGLGINYTLVWLERRVSYWKEEFSA